MGVSFACTSVIENKGELFNQQVPQALRIVTGELDELLQSSPLARISPGLASQPGELDSIARAMVKWIAQPLPMRLRLDGIAWMAQTLSQARLSAVRGPRLAELMDVLTGSLAAELPLHPVAPVTNRQESLLRSAVFARIEDPRPLASGSAGRIRTTFDQLRRWRAWRLGNSGSPVPIGSLGWGESVSFAQVADVTIGSALLGDEQCDSLVTRWLRASIEGGRAWGSGYYNWSAVDGLGAMALSGAAMLWLARAHAACSRRREVQLVDIRAALGRIDRTAGRAPWLGGLQERLRLGYLRRDGGLRSLIAAQLG